jgi:hypothetical protein
MQLDQEQIKHEIRAAIGEWTAALPPGKRATAREIFDALMPFVQKKAYYNQYLKSLTELTLGAAGLDEDHLEYRPGERPRLKSVPIRVGCAPQDVKRTFFTSDHHFGHANILKYEDANRRNAHGGKFASIEKMNEYLIKQWNATVAPGDLVHCLGDFSFKQSIMESILPRLHGEKVLIVGNHDPFYKRLTQCLGAKMHAEAITSALQAGFSEVHMELYTRCPVLVLCAWRTSHTCQQNHCQITSSLIQRIGASHATKPYSCTVTFILNGKQKLSQTCRQ